MPSKTPPVSFRSSILHKHKQQPSKGKPISSPKTGWLPSPSSHSRPDTPFTVATPSQPSMQAADVASADAIISQCLTPRLDSIPHPQPQPAPPSAALQQTDDSSATPAVTAATHDSPTDVAPLLPFGSPAVVRQLDASFFSSPCSDNNQTAAAAVAAPADTPSDSIPAAENADGNVVTTSFSATAPAVVISLAPSAATPSVPSSPHVQPPLEITTPSHLRIETASNAPAGHDTQPPSTAFKTPPVQRKRLKLLPPSSEASLGSGRLARSTSVGPPPPFLERQSPSDPPVVVARARRSRVNASRSSLYARVELPVRCTLVPSLQNSLVYTRGPRTVDWLL